MKKLTIRLDDETHQAFLIEAIKRGSSIQEMVEGFVRSVVSNTPASAKDGPGAGPREGSPQS